MRMLLRVRIANDAGNKAVHDGTIERIVVQFVEQHKPEAAYFFPDQGHRAASFVFDMDDSSQIVPLVEPFWAELDAEVQLVPVMNLEDLQKGLAVFAG